MTAGDFPNPPAPTTPPSAPANDAEHLSTSALAERAARAAEYLAGDASAGECPGDRAEALRWIDDLDARLDDEGPERARKHVHAVLQILRREAALPARLRGWAARWRKLAAKLSTTTAQPTTQPTTGCAVTAPLPIADAPAADPLPIGVRERIARMMYRGVPDDARTFTEPWAVGDSLAALGLANNQLVPIGKARLPDLLARALGKDYANAPDLVCAMLDETARELRFVHRAIRRGKCNSIVMDDVRDALRTAAARMDVAAELHRRLLVALSIFTNERQRHAVEKARRGEGAPKAPPTTPPAGEAAP